MDFKSTRNGIYTLFGTAVLCSSSAVPGRLMLAAHDQFPSLCLVLFWQREHSFHISCTQWHSLFDLRVGHLVMSMHTVVCSVVWSMCLWWTSCWLRRNPWTDLPLPFWPLAQIFQWYLILFYFLLLHPSHRALPARLVLVCDHSFLGYLHKSFHLVEPRIWSVDLNDS